MAKINSKKLSALFKLVLLLESNLCLRAMSEEQLKAFLEKVKDDTALREKIKSVSDVDAVLAIAKETGFAITADDIQSMKSSSELSTLGKE